MNGEGFGHQRRCVHCNEVVTGINNTVYVHTFAVVKKEDLDIWNKHPSGKLIPSDFESKNNVDYDSTLDL